MYTKMFKSSLCSLSHTIQPIRQAYFTLRKAQFNKYLSQQNQNKFIGCYSIEGGEEFGNRHNSITMKYWLSDKKYKNSNIGIGTYTGSLNQRDDILQFNAIVDSVILGSNVIDTCSNFRGGRSQLVIGCVLKYLIKQKNYLRNQIMISSKAGFIRSNQEKRKDWEVINDHCVQDQFLDISIQKSLQNMGVDMLDVFYINNFSESQLEVLGRQKFYNKLYKIFEFTEKCRRQKKIQYYGLASYQSFRLSPNHPSYLNLNTVTKIAQKIGGTNHGFKFIQVPINIMMPEAFAQKNQQYGSLLETAENLKINVVSCSPLLNGSLINVPLSSEKLKCKNNGAKHLQLIRSIPSKALICSLIGHKRSRHTKKNLQALYEPLLTEDQWFEIFVPKAQPNEIQA